MLGRRNAGDRLHRMFTRVGGLGNGADDAAQRACAIKRPLRPLEYLDAVDVIEPEVGVGRIVAEADVSKILSHRRLRRPGKARICDAADEQFVAPRPEMGRGYGRDPRQDRFGATFAAKRQIVAIQPGGDACKMRIGKIGLGCGDDDFLARSRHMRLRRFARPRLRRGARRRPPEEAWRVAASLDPPTRRAHPDGARTRARQHLPQRIGDVHAPLDGLDDDLPQRRVSDADADAALPAEHRQRRRQRTAGHIEGPVLRSDDLHGQAAQRERQQTGGPPHHPTASAPSRRRAARRWFPKARRGRRPCAPDPCRSPVRR